MVAPAEEHADDAMTESEDEEVPVQGEEEEEGEEREREQEQEAPMETDAAKESDGGGGNVVPSAVAPEIIAAGQVGEGEVEGIEQHVAAEAVPAVGERVDEDVALSPRKNMDNNVDIGQSNVADQDQEKEREDEQIQDATGQEREDEQEEMQGE